MPKHFELPAAIQAVPFTRRMALDAGVTPTELRSARCAHIGHSIYLPPGCSEDPEVVLPRMICTMAPSSWISHQTAMKYRGLWLPKRFSEDRTIHISRVRGSRGLRRTGVVGHQAQVSRGEVERLDEVPVSSPARAWLELGCVLTLDEMIQAADQLVRIPRPGIEGRAAPLATIDRLNELVEAHPRNPGARNARLALPLVRVGSDSIPETQCRLAIVRAGLPEPETQVCLVPGDPYSPTADLGYPAARIAIQYDGAVHLDSDRQSRDNRRDAAFSVAGWTVIKANRDDLRDGFRRLIELIRAALEGSRIAGGVAQRPRD